ncbi:RES family NAD+ phosphorylase [Catenovulum sp. SM1970]|uniref:RES family NAD+ phosphorylase n=1 Tax=Marinifaba aquimaris TaxID=2741323 RepID=UPI001571FDCD|nr:RES family NAD+ phosphorylase [Marinifaba aquimaris]NTS77536.1 RES family NAD+ phosphorylase [Marinifaba aquimaris]
MSSKVTIILPKEISDTFTGIGEHLKNKNRFSLPRNMEKIVTTFCESYVENKSVIDKGTNFWRARVHGVNQEVCFKNTEMGAPPSGIASAGRINPVGISYLYGAFAEKTAISEIRPWKGANVSVGKFSTSRDVNVVDLSKSPNSSKSPKLKPNESLEVVKERRALNQIISSVLTKHYFSAPAHNNDDHAYLASQYIAEKFKAYGIEALMYPSVLDDNGMNICFFSTDIAACENVNIRSIKSVIYEYDEPKKS